jgi:hypothetical protein
MAVGRIQRAVLGAGVPITRRDPNETGEETRVSARSGRCPKQRPIWTNPMPIRVPAAMLARLPFWLLSYLVVI